MAKKNLIKPVSEELIIDRLKYENPWWTTGETDIEFRSMKRRLYFNLFNPLITERDIKRAVVLMGPRRVGKTVMMYHAVQSLLDNKVNPHRICFVHIENPIFNNVFLADLFKFAKKAVNDPDSSGWYVFFDEIQYLKNWEVHLKVLVDDFPDTKFIVSGSAAAALKTKSTESGAGRFTDFKLPPLTFNEFIDLKNYNNLMTVSMTEWNNNYYDFFSTIDINKLNNLFLDYINFGGYPEVIFSEKIQSNPGRYIRSDIVDKVLLRDLPSLYGIQDVQELNSLFTTLAYNSGSEVSFASLNISSHADKYLIKKYLTYLEAAFLIKIVRRIDASGKKFRRDNFFKVYLTNPSLRSALFSQISFNDEKMGYMAETAIYSQWFHRESSALFYASVKRGEVDIVNLDKKKLKPLWAAEVKWSDRYFDKPRELKALLHFCKNNNLSSALVTTISKEGKQVVDGVTLYFIPASVYAYVVGYNAVSGKANFE
jgi:uncharacterized protein